MLYIEPNSNLTVDNIVMIATLNVLKCLNFIEAEDNNRLSGKHEFLGNMMQKGHFESAVLMAEFVEELLFEDTNFYFN